MSTTAQNLIDAAFVKIGYSDPTNTDRTNALINLNNLISSWDSWFDFLEDDLVELATISTVITLAAEYKEALVYNLAISLAEDKGINVTVTVRDTAQKLKDNLDRLNAINHKPTPESTFDLNSWMWRDIINGGWI